MLLRFRSIGLGCGLGWGNCGVVSILAFVIQYNNIYTYYSYSTGVIWNTFKWNLYISDQDFSRFLGGVI